jgi:hypothetical protein
MIPVLGRGHLEAVLPLFKEEPLGPGEYRGERQLPRSGGADVLKSITMAKLCQG